ncbi:MAG: C39 family peptidase [Chloroflexi bacterium]|nr:C39 family peptidase [Chloroflexota bacterium]
MQNMPSVPHKTQLEDGWCVPACAQMVLAYWGIEQTQESLAKKLQTITGVGTPASRLRSLASNTLEVVYKEGEIDDLRSALSQNIPPIALVHTRELPYWNQPTAHAVIVIGIENDLVILNDPAMPEGGTQVALGDFHLAWDTMANLYALLIKK